MKTIILFLSLHAFFPTDCAHAVEDKTYLLSDRLLCWGDSNLQEIEVNEVRGGIIKKMATAGYTFDSTSRNQLNWVADQCEELSPMGNEHIANCDVDLVLMRGNKILKSVDVGTLPLLCVDKNDDMAPSAERSTDRSTDRNIDQRNDHCVIQTKTALVRLYSKGIPYLK